jgi:Zonula occludens toxin
LFEGYGLFLGDRILFDHKMVYKDVFRTYKVWVMINIYTGIPGSGKTYKMVADLKALLEKQPDLRVISNITDLKLEHENLEELANRYSVDLDTFFSWEFQSSRIHNDFGPVVYVIDEFQRIFPAGKRQLEVETYFQLHRKLGHTLFMATQSLISVNRYIKPMFELEYAAARRSMTFFGEFRYRVKSPTSKEIIETIKVRPKQEIYALYSSFQANELLKSKPKLFLRIFIPFLFVLPIVAFALYKNIGSPFLSDNSKAVVPKSEPKTKSIPVVPSPVQSVYKQPGTGEPEIERVFLTIIKTGDKSLTIDPDTQAVVEVRHLGRRVVCVNDGLTCFYDRKVSERIKVADTSISSLSVPSFRPYGTSGPLGGGLLTPAPVEKVNEGPGVFVEPSLVPLPDFPR